MGGGHHAPAVPEPPYGKLLAPKSGLCPPEFHYTREVWYPHGGFYCDPKGWRTSLGVAMGALGLILYAGYRFSLDNEVRHRPPKVWIPSLLWNDNVPSPVDFRGRTLDRVTGKPVDGEEAHGHH